MAIEDIIRNALVDSGKFETVKYRGNNQIQANNKDEDYIINVECYTGLRALFG